MASSPNLLPSQRNDVFEFLRLAKLDPSEFRWTTRPSWYSRRSAPTVAHRDGGFYFMVDFGSHNMGIAYSPGEVSPQVEESFDRPDWAYTRPHLAAWVNGVAKELSTPDLWGELEQRRDLLRGAVDEENNTPFAAAELEQVFAALREIRELAASSFQLNQEQAQVLDHRLSYLEGAARRIGRVDWWNILLSVIFQLVLQAVITSDEGQEALAVAGKVLQSVYRAVPQLP